MTTLLMLRELLFETMAATIVMMVLIQMLIADLIIGHVHVHAARTTAAVPLCSSLLVESVQALMANAC